MLTKTELVRKNMVESVTNERNILAMVRRLFLSFVCLFAGWTGRRFRLCLWLFAAPA